MKDALGQVQSVLVLGGGSDIALATCRKLVQRRAARVVLAARKPEACDAAAAELRTAGASEVQTVAFDATDLASHESFVRATFDRFGIFNLQGANSKWCDVYLDDLTYTVGAATDR